LPVKIRLSTVPVGMRSRRAISRVESPSTKWEIKARRYLDRHLLQGLPEPEPVVLFLQLIGHELWRREFVGVGPVHGIELADPLPTP